MSDPWDRLSSILTSLVKRTEAPSVARRISELVKEEMTWWSEIDAEASFQWTREDITNYHPNDVDALLDEIKKIWSDEALKWIESNTTIRDHAEDHHDLEWS